MRGGISVVYPVFNEAESLQALYDRTVVALERLLVPFEIVFVDDCSTDASLDVLQGLATIDDRVVVQTHNENQGIFSAWKTGASASRFDVICVLDSDLQNPPEAIPSLWRRLQDGPWDFIQGTRSSIEWDRGWRRLQSRILNALLNVAFADDATDNKSGFLMGPKVEFVSILDSTPRLRYPHTFIRAAARSAGLSVGEVETLFLPRQAGTSFLVGWRSIAASLEVLIDIPRALRAFGRGPGSPVRALLRDLPATEISVEVHGTSGQLRRWFYFATMRLHAWHIRPSVKRIYFDLMRSQYMTREQIDAYQLRRLQRLLLHCYNHVPYYRAAMDESGLRPEDIRELADLRRFPMLSKDDVRANLYFDLFADTHQKRHMHRIATSGSTGVPFVTFADRDQLEVRFATTLRAQHWAGWRFGDRQTRLWHQTLGMSPIQAFKEKLDAILLRRSFVPAFEINEERLHLTMRKIARRKPVLLDGYAESLNYLARYLEHSGGLGYRPKGVMSSAQILPAQVRARIETTLGTTVFDKYGAREFSGIAYSCGRPDTHHVMDESYIVEIVVEGRPAMPGEVGEVLITDLNNFSVPLIRYRIGDLATAVEQAPCPCGRELSQVGEIQGRTQALVYCQDGTVLPGTFFAHFFKDYDSQLEAFQVVQEERGSILLKIVKGRQWSESNWQGLLSHLSSYLGQSALDVEFVDEIPLLKTGKRSPVVSTVNADFQDLGSGVVA